MLFISRGRVIGEKLVKLLEWYVFLRELMMLESSIIDNCIKM